MKYTVSGSSAFGTCKIDGNVIFKADKASDNAFFEVSFSFSDWEEDAFVFMPACAYNGNKFKKIDWPYGQQYTQAEYDVDGKSIPLIRNIPTMEEDGSGTLEVTSADMAVPCLGIFYRDKKEGIFIMTPQQVKNANIGYSVKKGQVKLSYPANRKKPYYAIKYKDYSLVDEKGISISVGEEITTEIYIEEFPCHDMADFYNEFFKIRKKYWKSDRVENLYTQELFELVEDMTNDRGWSGKTYPKHDPWYAGGWCDGCGIESAIFLKKGNAISQRRAIEALDYDTLPEHLTDAGFFYSKIENGTAEGKFQLTRHSASSFYHLIRNFELTQPKSQWINCVKSLADAFVKLFETYGTFGSYINAETGEMLIRFGHSGIMAIGGLAKSAAFFKNEKYRQIAEKAAEYYYEDFLKNGMTNSGPGDVLSSPDSESAFMMLESYVCLYELTKDEKWLKASETIAKYCSSWVVSYVHKFPEGTEFDRLKINTVGSVYASVQNAHSAPGICTLSGECIYKLYQYTGKQEYLELIKDIAYFIPQCVSTQQRPIYAYMGYTGHKNEPLKPGWINERVNMSDWERKWNGQGNVFYCNCWPSNAFLATYADLMNYAEFKAEAHK